jgi:uncharacterized protein (DUF1778 family)
MAKKMLNLQVRVSEDDKKIIQGAAEIAHLTVSAYVRQSALDRATILTNTVNHYTHGTEVLHA